MSGHGNHAPAPADKRIAILPDGVAPHEVAPTFKHFNFRPTEATPDSVLPLNAFVPNALGTNVAENYSVSDHFYGEAANDNTCGFKSEAQNVYALFERSGDTANGHDTLATTYHALEEFWNDFDTRGITVDKDNVSDYMRLALDTVKARLVAAGNSTDHLSAGMTMVKMFKQDGGWGAAVAHVGNTTHGFITNPDMHRLQGHGHTPTKREGRVMDLTQAEFNPNNTGKRFSRKVAAESSLSSDPNLNPGDSALITVIPHIAADSKIVLCNDEVINNPGTKQTRKPSQSIADRESAILDQGSDNDIENTRTNDRISEAMRSTNNNPDSALMIIDLQRLVKLEKALGTPPKRHRSVLREAAQTHDQPPVVGTAKKVAKLLHEFVTGATPEMEARRRHAAEAVAALALVGAAVYVGKHRFPEQTEALVTKAKDTKVVKKAGAFAAKASERGKEAVKASKPVQKAVEFGGKHAPKVAEVVRTARDKVKPVVVENVPEVAKETVVEPLQESLSARQLRAEQAKAALETTKAKAKALRERIAARKTKLAARKQR